MACFRSQTQSPNGSVRLRRMRLRFSVRPVLSRTRMFGAAIVAGTAAAVMAAYILAQVLGNVYGNGGISVPGPF